MTPRTRDGPTRNAVPLALPDRRLGFVLQSSQGGDERIVARMLIWP